MKPLPKILLVDDEKNVLESVTESLKDDYRIITAATGESAVEIMKRTRPDLIILDIKLPGVDGVKTLQIIKNIDSSIPVIMLSVINTINIITKLFRLGVYDYFDKPFNIYELKKSIKGAINYSLYNKKCGNCDIPEDIEMFIKKTANDMLKDRIGLKLALRKFDEEYVDLISKKVLGRF